MVIGLQKMTQVLEIPVQEHAIAGVGLEIRDELRPIDDGDHGAARDELMHERCGAGVWVLIVRQEEHHAGGCPGRHVDREILEASVTQPLRGDGRSGRGRSRSALGHCAREDRGAPERRRGNDGGHDSGARRTRKAYRRNHIAPVRFNTV
jgi:hypothetical protein